MVAALALAGIAAVAGLSYVAASAGVLPATAVRVARLTDFLGLRRARRFLPTADRRLADEGGPSDLGEADCRRRAAAAHARQDGYLRPRWSPDSSSIIFFASPPAALGTLWEVSGSAASRIVDSVADADVSHDGSRLAFVRSADGDSSW